MLILSLTSMVMLTSSIQSITGNSSNIQYTTCKLSRLRVITTGVVGCFASIYENIIAFQSQESRAGEDLNGDGDFSDYIIRYYDILTGTLKNTGIDGLDPEIYGDIIAFYTQENLANKDLNGDGDLNDVVIGYYNISSEIYVNTGIEGYNPSIYRNIIAFHSKDSFIMYYNISNGELTNTGVKGIYPSIYGNIIVFDAYWVKYYNLMTKRVVNIGIRGLDVDVFRNIITFQTQEPEVLKDLNGDGDMNDVVIWWYNITSGELTMINVNAWRPKIYGNIIVFHIWEDWSGEDLNKDGDKLDNLIGYYNIKTNELIVTKVDGCTPSIYSSIIAFDTNRVIRYAHIPIPAKISMKPTNLNLMSSGKWINAYIELPEGYNVSNIDVSSIMFNDTVFVDLSAPIAIGDYDNDTIPDLMIRFNWTEVAEYILSAGIAYDNVTLEVSGKLYNGTVFAGTDTILASALIGDVNIDGKVDVEDIYVTTMAYGSCPTSPRWNPNVNFKKDNKIDIQDIYLIARNFGKHA